MPISTEYPERDLVMVDKQGVRKKYQFIKICLNLNRRKNYSFIIHFIANWKISRRRSRHGWRTGWWILFHELRGKREITAWCCWGITKNIIHKHELGMFKTQSRSTLANKSVYQALLEHFKSWWKNGFQMTIDSSWIERLKISNKHKLR